MNENIFLLLMYLQYLEEEEESIKEPVRKKNIVEQKNRLNDMLNTNIPLDNNYVEEFYKTLYSTKDMAKAVSKFKITKENSKLFEDMLTNLLYCGESSDDKLISDTNKIINCYALSNSADSTKLLEEHLRNARDTISLQSSSRKKEFIDLFYDSEYEYLDDIVLIELLLEFQPTCIQHQRDIIETIVNGTVSGVNLLTASVQQSYYEKVLKECFPTINFDREKVIRLINALTKKSYSEYVKFCDFYNINPWKIKTLKSINLLYKYAQIKKYIENTINMYDEVELEKNWCSDTLVSRMREDWDGVSYTEIGIVLAKEISQTQFNDIQKGRLISSVLENWYYCSSRDEDIGDFADLLKILSTMLFQSAFCNDEDTSFTFNSGEMERIIECYDCGDYEDSIQNLIELLESGGILVSEYRGKDIRNKINLKMIDYSVSIMKYIIEEF